MKKYLLVAILGGLLVKPCMATQPEDEISRASILDLYANYSLHGKQILKQTSLVFGGAPNVEKILDSYREEATELIAKCSRENEKFRSYVAKLTKGKKQDLIDVTAIGLIRKEHLYMLHKIQQAVTDSHQTITPKLNNFHRQTHPSW